MTAMILFSILFTVSGIFAQQVQEKPLTNIPKSKSGDLYNVNYDAKTGAYVYAEYSDDDNTCMVVTPKGRSEKFFGVNSYNAYFDSSGNVYCAAYKVINDSVYTYFLLKNGEVMAMFDFINEYWAEKNGVFYFSAKDKDEKYFIAMDMATGAVTKSKAYDDVILVNITDKNYGGHGEPPAYPGFTAEGKPYYVAVKDSQYFMVVGDAEQKHYKDIDIYNVITDKNGVPVYFASESGSIYSDTAQVMLVQGDKEYRKFSYLYPPVLFDNNNVPIYAGGDKPDGGSYPQVVMKGNEEMSKKYTGGISDLQYTPSGKLAFIGNVYTDPTKSVSYIVVDGKESKKHNTIYSLTFINGDVPLYIEALENKQFVAKGNERISNAYEYIPYFKMFSDKLYYMGTNYANGVEDENYVYIDGEKYGSFQVFPSEDMAYDNLIATDDAGNYVFVGTKTIDKKNYIYNSYVYSKSGKSGPYSSVDNLAVYDSKPLFTGYVENKKENSATTCRINYNMKDITEPYDVITGYRFDPKAGTITFLASRKDDFYFVEIKL
jgi:hypothetical protein